MKTLAQMTIIEMQEYAREENLQLSQNASKSEILKMIISRKLEDMTLVELKQFVQKNNLNIPQQKNKAELLKLITTSLFETITGEIYKRLLPDIKDSLSKKRKTMSKNDMNGTQKQKIDKDINDLIESVSMPPNINANNTSSQKILSSCDNIKKYISHLIHLETEIDFLKKYLTTLQLHFFQCDDERRFDKKRIREYIDQKTKYETYNLIGKIELLSAMMDNPQQYISDIVLVNDDIGMPKPLAPEISKPQKPSAPAKPQGTKPTPPTPPIYKKSSFFNKKKVLMENEFIKKQYEAALEKYNIAKKQYQEEQEAFNLAQNAYESNLVIYKIELNKYNSTIKEYQKKLDEYNTIVHQIGIQKLIPKIAKELEATKAQIKSIQSMNENDFYRKVDALPEHVVIKFLSDEQRKVRREIKETVKIRNQLYSYNIIFDKYRNLIALSSLYEYIDSGRCNSLGGANGAYNLYEKELRANVICSKLDNIALSLETIKSNQFMLYLELNQINSNLKMINQGITEVVSELSTISLELQNINYSLETVNTSLENVNLSLKSIDNSSQLSVKNSSMIAYNTKIAAYNTAVSAHYSRITAARVDALGFLVAMK